MHQCFLFVYNIIIVKSSKLSRDEACKNMVENPIYESDGPVYDSVQPQFNSLTSEVTAAMNSHIETKLHDLESSASLQQVTEKNRYVSQPSLPQSCSSSFIVQCNDHSTMNGQLILQDGQGCSHCTTDVPNIMIADTNKCGEMLQPSKFFIRVCYMSVKFIIGIYFYIMILNSTGRIGCSSLSGEWDEQDLIDTNKCKEMLQPSKFFIIIIILLHI